MEETDVEKSYFAPGTLKGQVAFITGGGSGIGKTIALQFAQLGAKVAICGRRVGLLEEAAKEIKTVGTEVFFAPCDIREYDIVKKVVKEASEKLGPITILINCAGGQFPLVAEAMTANGFAAVIRNNLIGTWNVTHAVATTCMIPNRRGTIINITAVVKRGFPGMVHTGAARAGVENLTKTLAVEWAPYKVTINAVAPGVIKSTGTDRYSPDLIEKALKAIPLRRLGKQGEVSNLVTFLASPMAAFITGQIYYTDGGQSLWGDIQDPFANAKL